MDIWTILPSWWRIKMNEKKKRVIVSDASYVNVYVASKSIEEVARKLGLAESSVQSRACKLRKAGVKLPLFERKKKKIDVQALNNLIPNKEENQVE
jgi:transposase